MVTRINVELANDLGNLAQRSLSLIARNCGGVLPAQRRRRPSEDAALLAAAAALPGAGARALDRQAFHEALEEVWKVDPRRQRLYRPPGALGAAPDRPARMGAVLRVLADTLRVIATVLQPFMPGSMARMLDQLGVPADARTLRGAGDAAGRTARRCRRRRACSRATSKRSRAGDRSA